MRGTEHRTDNRPGRALLPLVGAAAGCCCSPAGSDGVSPASAARNDAGIPAERGAAVVGQTQVSRSGLQEES
ncbi:hypothetical protein [Arthrobacter sp. 754]|uniref:hypothetical protein n=1 Tax=Arthrobacter sp. 754 TaxID=3156315 RepID=UPI0033983341